MSGSNPLVAAKVDTTSPFAGAMLLDDSQSLVNSINSGDWVTGVMSGVGLALDSVAAAIDPIGTLIANGLGWLIDHLQPIKGWFDQLTGDADQVAAFAATWSNVAGRMHDVASRTTNRLTDLDGMSGDTIDAYRSYIDDAAKHLKMTGDWAAAVSSGLKVASGFVKAVHAIVRDVLSQLVGMVISAVIEAVATVGWGLPEIIAQLATRVAAMATKLTTTITDLVKTFSNLKSLLTPLREIIERARGLFDLLPPGKGSSVQVVDDAATALGGEGGPLIQILFKLGKGHDAAEFDRQLLGQEKGLNDLTVQEYFDNRLNYGLNGRSSAGDVAQRVFREDQEVAKVKELRAQGMSRADAQAEAKEFMKGKDALHEPDQIAGGHPDRISGLGDSRINSSIGSQWKSRVGDLDDAVQKLAATLTPQQRATTQLNVQLLRLK